MLFFYIRHGDPVYEPDSLTPFGERQAEALAKRLSRYGIDEIYTSTSQRTKDTAKPTCEMLKKDFVELDWCNEIYTWRDFSVKEEDGSEGWVFNSPKYRELFCTQRIKNLGNRWYEADEFKNTKFEKGIMRIHKETDAFFEQLGYKHDRNNGIFIPEKSNDKRIALFAHIGFGKALISSILDIPYPEVALHFDISHSSMTVISFEETDGKVIPKILTFSNDAHIYGENLLTNYNNEILF